MKTVKQIVENHLKEIGADGLVKRPLTGGIDLCYCSGQYLMGYEKCAPLRCVPARLIGGKMMPMEEKK
jgi:hypothetical protein